MCSCSYTYIFFLIPAINIGYISEFELKFNENPIYLFRNELNKLVNQELIEIDLINFNSYNLCIVSFNN